MNRILTIAACLLAVLVVPAATSAEKDPILNAIKARQAYMRVIGFNIGGLGAMAKGAVDHDAEAAAGMAKNLNALATMSTGAMWPQGSDNVAYKGETRAKPEAWSTYPKVAEAHQAFTDASAELVEVAGNGLDGLRSGMGALGDSCKGCHKEFRAKDF